MSKSESPGSLVPGCVPLEQFDLLLSGTRISGGVLKALEDYLVHGRSYKAAWESHGVNPSQFSRRLQTLRKESERASRLAKYYLEKS